MARSLLIVDVQPTFCEGGQLPVQGGNTVAFAVAELLSAHRDEYDLVVTSQDWHIDPADHFSDNPDYVDTWPPHGLADTPDAELHPAIVAALGEHGADVTIKKGQHAAAYSAFDGTDGHGVGLADVLVARGIGELDVCGIAESHCVRASVLDACSAGLDVRVLTALTVPVTPEAGAAARLEMTAAGAVLI